MLPSERRDVSEKLVGNDFVARTQFGDSAAEIDRVPEDDGGDGKVEAGGAVALVFESPIADFAEAMEDIPRHLFSQATAEAAKTKKQEASVANPCPIAAPLACSFGKILR